MRSEKTGNVELTQIFQPDESGHHFSGRNREFARWRNAGAIGALGALAILGATVAGCTSTSPGRV